MTTTSAVATLLPAGLQAVSNAISSEQIIIVSSWEIGSSAAIDVPSNTTGALPSAIYTGTPSGVIIEQENGIAAFDIILDESIGDFYTGNVALKVIDPITNLEVLLAVVMFPTPIYKTRSEAQGGATGAAGNYFLIRLHIVISASQSIATVNVTSSTFSSLPVIDDINSLADPSATTYPHQIILSAPETGVPALIARRPGDNIWWGFPFSWPLDSINFGVISGGYQGDFYEEDMTTTHFGGYFYLLDSAYVNTLSGGIAWTTGSSIVFGGTWN